VKSAVCDDDMGSTSLFVKYASFFNRSYFSKFKKISYFEVHYRRKQINYDRVICNLLIIFYKKFQKNMKNLKQQVLVSSKIKISAMSNRSSPMLKSSMALRSVRFGVRLRELSNVGQSLDG
jgi:hypothetical protein